MTKAMAILLIMTGLIGGGLYRSGIDAISAMMLAVGVLLAVLLICNEIAVKK